MAKCRKIWKALADRSKDERRPMSSSGVGSGHEALEVARALRDSDAVGSGEVIQSKSVIVGCLTHAVAQEPGWRSGARFAGTSGLA